MAPIILYRCNLKVIPLLILMMHGPKYQLQNISELCRNNSNDEPEVSLDGRVDRFGNPINK